MLLVPAKPLIVASSRVKSFFSDLEQIQNARSKISDLTAENNQLSSELVVYKELIEKTKLTKQELALIESYHSDQVLISANIIGRSPSKILDQIIIDKGQNDRIVQGQPVMSGGFLVGIIDEVSPQQASITLITNAQIMIPVITVSTRAQGILRGGLTGVTISDLSGGIDIQPGEAVITSGLAGKLPASIPIGKIEKIISSPSEILQKALLASPVNINRLERVVALQLPN